MKMLLEHQNVQTVEALKQDNNIKVTRVFTGDFYIIIKITMNLVKNSVFNKIISFHILKINVRI
jgi:hypothetical protein